MAHFALGVALDGERVIYRSPFNLSVYNDSVPVVALRCRGGIQNMPKMKTHKGAAKRFKVTGSGKFKRGHAYTNHILEHKSAKQKRNLRQSALASESDTKRIRKMMPYS